MSMKNINFRIPAELDDKLERLTKVTERPKTFFINKAIAQYLEDNYKRILTSKDPELSSNKHRKE